MYRIERKSLRDSIESVERRRRRIKKKKGNLDVSENGTSNT